MLLLSVGGALAKDKFGPGGDARHGDPDTGLCSLDSRWSPTLPRRHRDSTMADGAHPAR